MHLLNRRDFLRALGVSAVSLAVPGCTDSLRKSSGAYKPDKKPNFVFILIDDLGWADLGCYGNKFNETPNIDRLAREGMKFTDAYAACPVCSPTRASIIAGQYPARLGITDWIKGHQRPYEKLKVPKNRQQYLPLEAVTIAEALKSADYVSGSIGKWHLGNRPFFPDQQGFDTMLVSWGGYFYPNFHTKPITEIDNKAYLTEVLTGQAENFIETNKDKPFFLYLSHQAVHIPLEAQPELIEKYKNKPAPANGINNPIYAAMVEHVDRSVGKVLDKLNELGLAENTMVVFFSDNGGLRQRFDGKGPLVTSNEPLRGEKGSLYEGGIREPLIVRLPGVAEAGSICTEPVCSIDFYPTFLEISGAKAEPNYVLDGQSIVPLLRQTGRLKRDAIFWHYPHYHHTTPAGAIRAGKWKLIEYFVDGRVELYNLSDDIGEKNNLAEQMPQKARQLRRQLAAWRKSVNAEMPVQNPDYKPSWSHIWDQTWW